MKIRALIVDDEEQSVKALMNGMDWTGVGVTDLYGTYSAGEARSILLQEEIELILCDIEMPGESGLELIQWVREQADLNGANIECIILTCYPDYKYMRKAMQIGCSDYLIKPVDTTELTLALRKTICKIRDRGVQNEETEDSLLKPVRENIIMTDVIPYIKEHFTEKITVAEIASDAALNMQYMMRLFKRTTGVSVLEYVTELRLERARELLDKTNWGNEIISEKIGYGSSNYFIKLFKKKYGLTPREYRKSHFRTQRGHD